MRSLRPLGRFLVVTAIAIGAIAACSSGSKGANGPENGTSTTAAPTTTTTLPCNPLASYAPDIPRPAPGAMPAGSKMAEIAQRGYLKVGVSADTYNFGFWNPLVGELQGFDVDMAHAVAKAIFGDPNAIKFTVMSLGQRQKALTDNAVDMVADVYTMTCGRWNDIAFSSQYFSADKKILVAKDSGTRAGSMI